MTLQKCPALQTINSLNAAEEFIISGIVLINKEIAIFKA
jgi:hypothetical protein